MFSKRFRIVMQPEDGGYYQVQTKYCWWPWWVDTGSLLVELDSAEKLVELAKKNFVVKEFK